MFSLKYKFIFSLSLPGSSLCPPSLFSTSSGGDPAGLRWPRSSSAGPAETGFSDGRSSGSCSAGSLRCGWSVCGQTQGGVPGICLQVLCSKTKSMFE